MKSEIQNHSDENSQISILTISSQESVTYRNQSMSNEKAKTDGEYPCKL